MGVALPPLFTVKVTRSVEPQVMEDAEELKLKETIGVAVILILLI